MTSPELRPTRRPIARSAGRAVGRPTSRVDAGVSWTAALATPEWVMVSSSEVNTDGLWRTLEVVSEWIRFADAKAGAVLAVNGVMLALFTGRLREQPGPGTLATVVLSTAIALAAASGVVAVWIVVPRVGRAGASMVHYGTIAGFPSAVSYRDAALKTFGDPAELVSSLTLHIWVLSRIAARKYRMVSWAVRFLLGAVVVGILALLIH